MKTALHIGSTCILFLLLSQAVLAQQMALSDRSIAFKKGSQQIMLSYGYGQGYLISNRNIIQLQAGYYVANHLLIGVVGSLAREWIGETHTAGQLSVGPSIRYQLGSSRFSPFAEAAYLFGRPTPAMKQAAVFTPGLSFGLLPQVRLEASYRFIIIPQSERSGLAQVGVTYLLGTKR